MHLSSKSLILKSYFMINALESAVVFYLISSIPSDLKNTVFLGYSLPRLAMLGMAFVLFAFFGFLFVRINLSDITLSRLMLFVEDICAVRSRRLFLTLFPPLLVILGIILFLTPLEQFGDYSIQVERASPIVYLGCVLGIQTLFCQFLWRKPGLNWRILLEWKRLFVVTGIIFGFFLVFSAWVARTGIGLQPENYGWHYPGAPIVFSQLFLAWLAGVPFVIWGDSIANWVSKPFKNQPSFFHLDMFVCLILWSAAFLIWWGEPMRKESYFNPSPTPPNSEYYPYSDAALYDQSAQKILIGDAQNNKILLRPLYVFFLSFLHVIGGQRYDNVIFFQILFLAVMPALAYLLASLVGGRAAGLMTAILIIFREKNSIALTNVIEISHSKLLLSDVPMMALVLLLVYVLVKWLKRPANVDYLGIFAGASFGMVMLVRSHQALLIIPALLLGMFFSGGLQLKKALQRSLMFVLGFAIVAAPWIWRNYLVNGKPAIESSEFYISWYAGAYTEPTDTVDMLPGESSDEYSSRIKRQVFQYVLHHPFELAHVYTSYFIRNEIDSIVYLPMSLKLYDPRLYVSQMRFWDDPLINLGAGSGLIFLITLGLMILGIVFAVQRLGFLGLLPLLIHFAYNFSMSLARISGWRFVLPVDWVLLLYFCVGLVQLTIILISLIQNKVLSFDMNEVMDGLSASTLNVRKTQYYFTFFLLLGLSLPLTEKIIPELYPDISSGQIFARFMPNGFAPVNGGRFTVSDLNIFLETEAGATVLYGRALYPSFYRSGDFWGDQQSITYLERGFNRLHFALIGPKETLVFIPLEKAPKYFPHASDVVIIGCRLDEGVRALAVRVNDQASFITASPWRGLTCASQE